jgi:hypothetical protein
MNATFDRPAVRSLGRMVLGMAVVVIAQAGIGMVVNLYVTIPAHHPGAHPSSYLGGSIHSVGWAIAHSEPALAIHALFGLALVLMALTVAYRSFSVGNRTVSLSLILAAGLVIGAGFNGASFLDFNHNVSSLIMALLSLGAVACYAVALFVLAETA